jgi:hypothetical protein
MVDNFTFLSDALLGQSTAIITWWKLGFGERTGSTLIKERKLTSVAQ